MGGLTMGNVIIAENCKKVNQLSGGELVEFLKKHPQGLMDDRHDIFSLNNTMDKTMYLNYLQTIKEIAQSSKHGRFTCLLDLGYMPVLMPPFYISTWYPSIVAALEAHGVPYTRLPASSFAKDMFSHNTPDIWVSKLDCVDLLKKPAQNIRVNDLLDAIHWEV